MSENRAALRRSLSDAVKIDQGMLRYVLDQSRDCIKILGPDGHIEYINSEGRCVLEITDFATVCGKRWPDLWPDESKHVVERALADAQNGGSSEFEAWRPDGHGEKRWWRISVSPLLEASGELAGILTISRDVTEHVRLRETEQTLALEMRHRLRNAYTVASAILMQSARNNPAAQPFAESVAARLADVALSQTRLLDAGERSWPIADLIGMLVEAHGEGAAGIHYAGNAHANVDGHEAMLIALVIGELTTNSVKYGALGRRKPVSLSWRLDSENLIIRWREHLPLKTAQSFEPRSAGSGYSLMERMARSQRATFGHDISDSELNVTLKLNTRRAK
jgi:PAS domain S-box-containing protein